MANFEGTQFSLKTTDLDKAKKELMGKLINIETYIEDKVDSATSLNELKNICTYLQEITRLTEKIDCDYFNNGVYTMLFDELTTAIQSYQYYKDGQVYSDDNDIKAFQKFGLK